MDVKTCSRCERSLPLCEFNRRASALDGLQTWCRQCMTAKARERRQANPEKVRDYNAKYRQERGDVAAAATARWRAANSDRVAEQKRKWAAANRQAIRDSDQRNRESRGVALAAWKKANPEKVRAYQRKRRAAGYGGDLGEVDGDLLWLEQQGQCALCSAEIDLALNWPDPLSRSLDHKIALAVGGAHITTNCQWTHLVCNLRKGAR